MQVTEEMKSAVMRMLGQKGGAAKTPRKAAQNKLNALKGWESRPRKNPPPAAKETAPLKQEFFVKKFKGIMAKPNGNLL